MKCSECNYKIDGIYEVCDICHIVLNHPLSKQQEGCKYYEEYIKTAKICYNCNHWIGGGDWGLSCKKDYYNTSSNGFDEACDKFEVKNEGNYKN